MEVRSLAGATDGQEKGDPLSVRSIQLFVFMGIEFRVSISKEDNGKREEEQRQGRENLQIRFKRSNLLRNHVRAVFLRDQQWQVLSQNLCTRTTCNDILQ